MACAPCDVFAFVVAAFASECGRLDAVTVDTPRRGVLVTPRLLASLGTQGVGEALQSPLSRHGLQDQDTLGHVGYAWGSMRHLMPPSTR
jgi:hypothetical protein